MIATVSAGNCFLIKLIISCDDADIVIALIICISLVLPINLNANN